MRKVSGIARATVVALRSLQFTARLLAAGNGAGKKEKLNVARRVMDPKDVHILVPRTWAWGTFQGRREFADVTKAVDQPDGVLRKETLSWGVRDEM